MAGIEERQVDAGGIDTLVRVTPGDGVPVLFWHGNPTDSNDWSPFMERLDRPSFAADLPGFGGSEAPAGFGATMDDYADWAESLVGALALERYACVVHDWGAVGLLAALRHPERIERLVLLNPVPVGTSYRWHWIARWFFRRRLLGEMFSASARGPAVGLVLRQARPGFKAMPGEFIDRVHANLRRPEMRRAMLSLYRSADRSRVESAGAGLAHLDVPALILWGMQDLYIPVDSGRRLARLMPNATLDEIDGAGHWPWFDRPDLIDRVVRFLET
ncbi:alpha/beta hydrolase [soil metagenome]